MIYEDVIIIFETIKHPQNNYKILPSSSIFKNCYNLDDNQARHLRTETKFI